MTFLKILIVVLSALAALVIEILLPVKYAAVAIWETLFVGGEKVAVRRRFK